MHIKVLHSIIRTTQLFKTKVAYLAAMLSSDGGEGGAGAGGAAGGAGAAAGTRIATTASSKYIASSVSTSTGVSAKGPPLAGGLEACTWLRISLHIRTSQHV